MFPCRDRTKLVLAFVYGKKKKQHLFQKQSLSSTELSEHNNLHDLGNLCYFFLLLTLYFNFLFQKRVFLGCRKLRGRLSSTPRVPDPTTPVLPDGSRKMPHNVTKSCCLEMMFKIWKNITLVRHPSQYS